LASRCGGLRVAEGLVLTQALWHSGLDLDGLKSALSMTIGASPLVVLLALFGVIVGLPLYLVFRALRLSRPLWFVLGASLVAITVYALPSVFPNNPTVHYFAEGHNIIVRGERTPYGWLLFWRGVLTSAAAGALVDLVFWLLLCWRPVNRDTSSG
jgi:hypothetical protein